MKNDPEFLFANRRFNTVRTDDRMKTNPLVDGWRFETCEGAWIARHPSGVGFVSMNDDSSGLYVADCRDVPWLVIDKLRELHKGY